MCTPTGRRRWKPSRCLANRLFGTLEAPCRIQLLIKSLLQTGLKIFQGHQQHAEHPNMKATLKIEP
jgi:predicted outer membrane protein